MLKVLGRPTSINVRKVLWTLDEIGTACDHEAEWATPAAPSRSPAFLRLNPDGLVPVLIDGDEILTQSNTICRYLVSRHGRDDLLPVEPLARARVEMWMDWQVGELGGVWGPAFLWRVRRDPAHDDAARVAASAAAWTDRMAVLEDRLGATGPFLTGSDFTLADICVGLAIHRYRSTPDLAPLGPATTAYAARMDARPAGRAHLGPATP